ncbi:FAD binding domain-containing protein [bacterium]|jgi:carbon-monoxide dehydrogenase medium subunit|nr:FAD binding domain-containing protein [bacterium]
MKPPKFAYHAPTTVREAVELLAELGDDVVVLSGGQSLIPMLNLRLANPTDVIDLGGVDGLGDVAARDGGLDVGAMVTHRQMETNDLIASTAPLAQHAAGFIGYRAIRNRGTIGGSIAHADPAAEWPAVVLALDGAITLTSAEETRNVAGDDFFESLFTTAKRPDELVTSVHLAGRFQDNWGFSEFQRRTGDFAVVAVAVGCVITDSSVVEARVALAGVAERPLRCPAAEQALTGPHTGGAAEVAAVARDSFEPVGDSHGSSEYRKRLVFAETHRAVAQALGSDIESIANA